MTRLLVPLALVVACGSEEKLSVYDAAPDAVITSHGSGDSVRSGDIITLTGTVSDSTDDLTDLTATWFSDDSVACDALAPLEGGLSTCEVLVPEGEGLKIRLEVRDPGDNTGNDSITLTIAETQAPEVRLNAPVAGDVYTAGEPIVYSATVTDAEDEPEDLTLWFESSLDGRIDITSAPTSDGELNGSIVLSAGDHNVALWAEDSHGQTDSASVIVTVEPPNVAPTCGITSPDSGTTAAVGSLIVLEATVNDEDSSNDSLAVAWTSDEDGDLGSSTPSSTGNVAFPIDTLNPNTHTISMTVTDEDGATCTDFILLTVSTPPTLVVNSPSDGDRAHQGDPVTFSALVTDTEDPSADLNVRWESSIDGRLWFGPPDSSGDSVFISDGLSLGTHTLTITATDSDGLYATAVQLLTINGKPSAPTVSIAPDTPQTGDDLTATIVSPSVDPDGDTIAYSYSWIKDGIDAGEPSASLDHLATAKGDIWTVIVTPSDESGAGEPGSASVTIVNTPPVLERTEISPSTPSATDELTCTTVGVIDADGDAVAFAYSWAINGVDAGVTEPTLSDGFAAGDSIQCTATPNDGESTGSAATSTAILIANTAPTEPGISIEATADSITCIITDESTDIDGDSIDYIIEWDVDGTDWTDTETETHDGDTVLSDAFAADQVWTCEVTPTDGESEGPTASASHTIETFDADGDGVMDDEDLCPGYDDTIDGNANGIPDACETSVVFDYTGTPQTFTVRDGSTQVYIEAMGAQGWQGSNPAGQGGFASGTLEVTEGEELYIYVGGQGERAIGAYNPMGGGWNGGGDGQNNGGGDTVGGGGGASDVRLILDADPLNPESLASRVLVAGGGGSSTNNSGARGGHGGSYEGEDGGQHSGYHYGRGGTQDAGGDVNGGFGFGGYAEATGSMTPWNGGGGGGWYGGGVSTDHSGGGGGSCYIGGVIDGSAGRGGHTGNGQVVIYWAESP